MDILIDQLQDPLDQTTRKTRKGLLLSLVIAIIVIRMELVPTRITALGIELYESDQNSFIMYLWSEFKSGEFGYRN